MKFWEVNGEIMTENVVFLRSHRVDQEIRTPKEIKVLQKLGYDIKLINWDRDGVRAGYKRRKVDGYDELQLKFNAPAGIVVFPFLFIWWIFSFIQLMRLDWDIVHAINLDSIPPAVIASKLKRKKVIYEILDIYEFNMDLNHNIQQFFVKIDKMFMKYADAVIFVDEKQITGLGGVPNDNVFVIYDSPPFHVIADISTNDEFTLFYAGVLFKMRKLNLDKLIEAIKLIDDVKLIIAGYGDMVDEIKNWEKSYPSKIKYMGKISYEDVFEIGKKSDLFFILRDPVVLVNRFTCGSTLFNAMLCEKPILVNEGNATSEKVLKHNCGLVVNANDVQEIKKSILKLKNDHELCKKLGMNGKKAFQEIYSWKIMTEKLENLYLML